MSKYKIFRIDHYDPLWVGRRRRRLNLIFASLAIIAAPLMFALKNLLNFGLIESYLTTITILLGFFLILYLKLRTENKSIKTIGDIEFTKTCINKHIGDSSTVIKYDSIKSFELQKHIPALTLKESKSGFFTYIMSIHFKDSHKETLIVSDRPAGKWQDLSITETIKTLTKLYLNQDINNTTKR